jgi:hypothetical protein
VTLLLVARDVPQESRDDTPYEQYADTAQSTGIDRVYVSNYVQDCCPSCGQIDCSEELIASIGMAKRKHEKTQKGNPHALPIRQHVFPSASIARFADNGGVVSLHHLLTGQVLKAKPSNPIFCAMRAWDTRAEIGYMKQIEDEFQELASRIIKRELAKIEAADKHKVDRFFALWKMRAIFKSKEVAEVQIKGIAGEKLTKDQEEKFEKIGVLFMREGGVMSAHRVHGLQIQIGVMREASVLSNLAWGIVRAQAGQFVVPDFPAITFIPLEPTLCLCGTAGNFIESGTMLKDNLIDLNHQLRAASKEYYFANDLRECF